MATTEGITQVTLGQAPDSVRKVCADWNRLAKDARANFLLSCVCITVGHRSHVNHRLQLRVPSGQRFGVSLGDIDKKTVQGAIRALVARSGVKPPFEF